MEEKTDGSNDDITIDHLQVGASIPKDAPIQSETATRARKEFLMEMRRQSRSNSASNSSASVPTSDVNGRVHLEGVTRNDSDTPNHPNLEIPIGGFRCSIAQ